MCMQTAGGHAPCRSLANSHLRAGVCSKCSGQSGEGGGGGGGSPRRAPVMVHLQNAHHRMARHMLLGMVPAPGVTPCEAGRGDEQSATARAGHVQSCRRAMCGGQPTLLCIMARSWNSSYTLSCSEDLKQISLSMTCAPLSLSAARPFRTECITMTTELAERVPVENCAKQLATSDGARNEPSQKCVHATENLLQMRDGQGMSAILVTPLGMKYWFRSCGIDPLGRTNFQTGAQVHFTETYVRDNTARMCNLDVTHTP